jgi:hypothetical protein
LGADGPRNSPWPPRFDRMETNLKDDVNKLRELVLEAGKLVLALKKHPTILGAETESYGEMLANVTLAFRHLEDARMRLGKVIQASEDGKSCYDGPKGK